MSSLGLSTKFSLSPERKQEIETESANDVHGEHSTAVIKELLECASWERSRLEFAISESARILYPNDGKLKGVLIYQGATRMSELLLKHL